MKRVIVLLLCLAMSVGVLASCESLGIGSKEEHSHTYSTTWSKDSVNHWYDATCECTDATVNKLAHADANNDGACDVCGFTDHTHTYSENWTVDCTNHWNAADCGHVVAGTNVAAHVDSDNDGKCDVCKYVIKDIHTHYFSTEWSSDETNHWHAALCEHSVAVADKAAHEVNAAGYCSVCGAKVSEVDEDDVSAIIAAAVAQYGNIASGEVLYNYTSDGYSYADEKSYYFLGEKSAYITKIYDYFNYPSVQMLWLEDLGTVNEDGEKNVFSVESWDGGITINQASATENEMGGCYYTLSTFTDGHYVELVISNIYDIMQSGTDAIIIPSEIASGTNATYGQVRNVTEIHDQDTNMYGASFDYLEVQLISQDDGSVQVISYLYSVEYSFAYTDNYEIINSYICVSAYSDGSNVMDDVDYVYDRTTGDVTMSDEAGADTYSYVTVQIVGEKNYNTIYPKASLVPTDFELFLDDTYTNMVEDEITTNAGTSVDIYIGQLVPFTAKVDFFNAEDFIIEVVNNDADSEETFYPYFSTFGGYINFYPTAAGDYTMTITYGDVEKVIDVTVLPAVPESVNFHVFEWIPVYGGGEIYFADEYNTVSRVSIANGETFDFVISIAPFLANQGYTYVVEGEGGSVTEIALENVSVFGEDFETYTALRFSAAADGIYKIIAKSTEDDTVAGELTVVYGDVVSDSTGDGSESDPFVLSIGEGELLYKGYAYAWAYHKFTATSNGYFTLTVTSDNYDIAAGYYPDPSSLYYSFVDGNVCTVYLEAGETIYIGITTATGSSSDAPITYVVEFEEESGSTGSIAGVYTGTDDWGNEIEIVITDTTIEFTLPGLQPTDVVISYTYEGDYVTLYDPDGNEITNPYAAYVNILGGVPTYIMYNGNTYNLSASGSTDDGNETESDIVVGANDVEVTADDIFNQAITFTFVVTESGMYEFGGDFSMINIYNGMGMNIGRGMAYLDAGTYTIEIYVGAMANAGTYNLQVTYTET